MDNTMFSGLLFCFSGVDEFQLKKIVIQHGGETSSIVSPKVRSNLQQKISL